MISHNHQHCIQDALRRAEEVCARQGARFTPIRRRVLELVWQRHEPVKAYDLLDILQDDSAAKPPTVYRALEFLMERGLVHKVESLNAYVGCDHPGAHEDCYFLLCKKCGNLQEFCDNSLGRAIAAQARKQGFKVHKQTVEVEGLCKNCDRIQ